VAYGTSAGDLGNATFQAGNIMYQTTQAILQAEDGQDMDILNDAVMLMDTVTSYFTDSDPVFVKEWAAIGEARRKATIRDEKGNAFAYEPGHDNQLDAQFRWRELRAMFRSMCRIGKMTRVDSPNAEWTPAVTA
jgi:hypothetical protein